MKTKGVLVACDHGQYDACVATNCPHLAPHEPCAQANGRGMCTDEDSHRCYPWLDRPKEFIIATCKEA